MAVKNKIISFWKQARLQASDMFTLFKVGIGIKVPTHKLHVKDTTDPLKIEGLQNDTTDPDKFLTIDSSNIVKYRTGTEVLSDIGGTPLTTEEVQDIAGALVATGGTKTGVTVTYQDSTGDMDFEVDHDAATNFVAAEHYRWDTDISATATIHTNNITDLHGAGVNGSANQLLTDDGDGTVTSEPYLKWDSSNELFSVTGDSSGKPKITIASQNVDAIAPELIFQKAVSGADGDNLGKILFQPFDTDGNYVVDFAQILGEVQESDYADAEGKLTLSIASHDREIQPGLIIASGNAEDEVDVTIGNTATSITTIAGTLTMGSTAFADNSGVIQVATQGTIDHDSLANFVANEHIDWTGSSAGTIHSTNIPTLNQDTTGNAATATNLTAGDKTLAGIITTKGHIIDGDRNGGGDGNGVAIHVDSMDITDNTTSASGTALMYNHISIENPRVLATNSSVTTTTASTLFIKGAPVASTNQTITNSYALHVATGDAYFGANIIAGNNRIKDDDGVSCIIFDSSGNTTIANTLNATLTGNVTGNASGSSGSCTGNAATATALATARAINGVDFDGTAAITIPTSPGWLGSSTRIKILPSDFIADDGGRPVMIDDTGSDRWLESHSTLKMYASIAIPTGYTATECAIYGSATSAITVYEADINSKTVTSKGTGNIGTAIDGSDFTNVASDTTNYLLIELAQASGEEVYGGYITIAAT